MLTINSLLPDDVIIEHPGEAIVIIVEDESEWLVNLCIVFTTHHQSSRIMLRLLSRVYVIEGNDVEQ